MKFAVGKSDISPGDLEQLQEIGRNRNPALTGYLIEVKGFADASGDAKMNEKLSKDRAEAVVGYLIQQCNVPVAAYRGAGRNGRISTGGIQRKVKEGRAENHRRVEVKVLVNKGIAGS